MELPIAFALALRFPKITIVLLAITGISIWVEGTVHRPIPAPAQTMSVSLDGPDAATVSPASWADALLNDLGDPDTPANVHAVMSWEAAEGGNWHNDAAYNPLNTTQPWPAPPARANSWPINSVGVQAYPTWDEGMHATVATLRYPAYVGVLAALSDGNCASCVANAVGASPWGTGRFAV